MESRRGVCDVRLERSIEVNGERGDVGFCLRQRCLNEPTAAAVIKVIVTGSWIGERLTAVYDTSQTMKSLSAAM